MKRSSIVVRAVATIAVSALVGCGGGSDDGASLRVIHNSPDAPNVDVRVDGAKVLTNVAYKESSGYLPVDAGTRSLEVLVTGTDTVAIAADAELSEDTSYSVLAINKVSSIEPLVLIDKREPDGDTGCAVRVVHGAPSAPAVDVYATTPNADLSAAAPVLTNVPFKASSDYLNVPCGVYQFRVTLAGTKAVAIDTGAVSLTDGTYTAIAQDNKGGGAPFSVLLLSDK